MQRQGTMISVILLLSILLTSCGNAGSSDNPDTTTENTDTETIAEETTTADTSPDPKLEPVDCGGKEYNILSREIDGYTFPYSEFYSEEQNGDTVLNGDDMFGLTCNAFCWQPLFAGTDSLIIQKDKDDKPYLAWGSERNMAVMGKIIGLLNDRSSTILVNQFPELEDAGGWGNASIKMFTEDRALFRIEIIYGVLQLRDMDTDFGLLPMPKY